MTLKDALSIIGGISSASKMPCQTYNLSAWKCNRGSKLRLIQGSVCSKCYARRAHFCQKKIIKFFDNHYEAMKNPLWVEAMAQVINQTESSGYFRWLSSGDIPNYECLLKIIDVCKLTPRIKHWLPTKEIGLLYQYKQAGEPYPKNLTIRLCADMLENKPSDEQLNFLGVLGAGVSKIKNNCHAHKQGNKCLSCRKCWERRTKVVVYKQH